MESIAHAELSTAGAPLTRFRGSRRLPAGEWGQALERFRPQRGRRRVRRERAMQVIWGRVIWGRVLTTSTWRANQMFSRPISISREALAKG